ncbi:PIG-L family deacetylase [Kineococcus indalonis]|uniref:PIG-L family deacetylase n=1 Tax=Kineococcus indalonis TaxID=2696566 RepID=UPI0014133F14|nr:bifunctional PIG-L family deacetylase/class I SAM-dependent methyltransferase [Kineococcus indalonis]NAZ87550.1 methyltransferase domain-containing protein [Kineococcus indalonis]
MSAEADVREDDAREDDAREDDARAFTHDGAGTPEEAWRRWPGLGDLPVLELRGLTHLVVVAAHPDDETLGAGGLLARAADAGARIDVVVATDGEASHPGSPTTTPEQLARVRAVELERAVAALAPGARVHRLQLGDGRLAEPERAGALREAVAALVRPASWLACPWRGDGHPDHEAAALAAAAAARAVGARVLQFPVWAWHWAHPGDARVPWARAVRLPLEEEVLRRKRSALAEHVSQTAPLSPRPGDEALLAPGVLRHFTRAAEVFLTDGSQGGPERGDGAGGGAAASLPASFFEEFYAEHGEDPWGFEDRWYERRKRALTLASLPRERFRSALEVGCSGGVFTAELAPRCGQLLALDAAASAVQRARGRVRAAGFAERVDTRVGTVPRDWPGGVFDLVVLSEVAYYCGPRDLAELVARAAGSLAHDGVLVACHWRHLVRGYPLTGDEVHRVLRAEPGLQVLAAHEEEDFLLDVLVPAPAVSVARAGGLTP